MLFKDLKNIISEADEAPADGEATENIEDNTSDGPRRPDKVNKDVQQASDGVGNESYNISEELQVKLRKILPLTFNINREGVTADSNMIEVVFDFGDSEEDIFIMRKTGNEVALEAVITHIQTLVMSDLSANGKNVELDSNYLGGVLTITVKSSIETEND